MKYFFLGKMLFLGLVDCSRGNSYFQSRKQSFPQRKHFVGKAVTLQSQLSGTGGPVGVIEWTSASQLCKVRRLEPSRNLSSPPLT